MIYTLAVQILADGIPEKNMPMLCTYTMLVPSKLLNFIGGTRPIRSLPSKGSEDTVKTRLKLRMFYVFINTKEKISANAWCCKQ